MKRTVYITYYHDMDPRSPEAAFNQEFLPVHAEKPSVPYIEVEMTVKSIEKNFEHARSAFADKIGANIIIPEGFTK